jgi:hypothetical protein
MKYKMYTKSHSERLLQEIGNENGIFTASEHAYIIEREFGNHFESRELLLRHYLSTNAEKLSALAFLIKYANDKRFVNIISLGAGACVLEHLLKYALPEGSTIVATDFDPFFIEKARLLFPSIIAEEFDFFRDDLVELRNRLKIDFDLAIFLNSSYVMDNVQFVKLFHGLARIGVKQIVDFQGGFVTYVDALKAILVRRALDIDSRVGKLLKKVGVSEGGYRGKFHGYARTRGELRSLYRKAGLNVVKEIRIGPWKYIAICEKEFSQCNLR